MSHYGDHYRELEREDLLRRWEPTRGWPAAWDQTTRYHYARAEAAEHRLRELTSALSTLRGALR
jgi:hypothetical protein